MTGFSEDTLFESQRRYIQRRFGRQAAEHASYGWAIDEATATYTTKVHGYGIVSTRLDRPNDHEFEDLSAAGETPPN